ncbi:MAG: GntR family transcriptional regulator [Verrucomicrobia bacterium]|nr:GntR family transcriptional regulator [Verrucomicrobiota bacterium]
MKSPFSQLELDELQLPQRQIEKFVRGLIVAGKIAPSMRIPSTRELAETWGMPLPTVHAALAALNKDGLLVRQHGRGTFVRRREERLTWVGIYYPEKLFVEGGSQFVRSVHSQLKRVLDELKIQTNVWLDPRGDEEQGKPWPVLVSAAQRRKIQALILPQTDWPHLRWTNKLPIPVASFSTANLPNTVHLDLPRFAELSLRRLAEQGCRSVGLIAPICPDSFEPGGNPHDYFLFIKYFLRIAGELGLKIRNKWMRLTKHEHEMRGQSYVTYGYRQFHNLWQQVERPSGLVVSDDVTAQGAVMAILEKQVNVPGELKLVFDKNENINLPCPVPVSHLVASEREIAQALIKQVQRQFRGERCEPLVIGHRFADKRETS